MENYIVINGDKIELNGFEKLNNIYYFKFHNNGLVLDNKGSQIVPTFVENERLIINKSLVDKLLEIGLKENEKNYFLFYHNAYYAYAVPNK